MLNVGYWLFTFQIGRYPEFDIATPYIEQPHRTVASIKSHGEDRLLSTHHHTFIFERKGRSTAVIYKA